MIVDLAMEVRGESRENYSGIWSNSDLMFFLEILVYMNKKTYTWICIETLLVKEKNNQISHKRKLINFDIFLQWDII